MTSTSIPAGSVWFDAGRKETIKTFGRDPNSSDRAEYILCAIKNSHGLQYHASLPAASFGKYSHRIDEAAR